MRVEQQEYEKTIDVLKSQVHEADFQSLWQAGTAMTIDDAIRFALDKGGI
jgi:hypothetical protein